MRPGRSSTQVKKVGQVFLYKIYDSAGVVRFVSDDLPEGASDEEGLAEHNAEAAEAVEAGRPQIEAGEGQPPSRPPFLSEAYVPVVVGGKTIAVVETYIDQTAKRAEFHRAFTIAAVGLGLLVAAAFGAPAAAWFARKRAHQRADAHIRYLANFDSLSGVANRARLNEVLTGALADRKDGDMPLAAHVIDIDRFKDLNDLFGLDLGDKVIRAVADRLTSLVAPGDLVARLGGDEFAIVQMNPASREAAFALARRIVDQMSMPVRVAGHDIPLTVGVGVAVAPADGDETGQIIKNAELALFKAKSEGPGQACLFSPISTTNSVPASCSNGASAPPPITSVSRCISSRNSAPRTAA